MLRFGTLSMSTDTIIEQATMGVRLPTILGKAIDDVVKTLNDEVSAESSRSSILQVLADTCGHII